GGTRLGADDVRALVLGSCDPPPVADRGRRLGRGYLNVEALVAARMGLVPPAEADETLEEEPGADSLDVVVLITDIGKPGDVADYWRDRVRPNRADSAHPLSELET